MAKVAEFEEKTVAKTGLLEAKLRQLVWDVREAVDLTIQIRHESPHSKPDTIRMWEEFLASLFGYIKLKSKENKDNLLSGISLTRLKLF